MFLDLGTASREETEALGVRVGDPVTFVRTGMPLNGTRVFTGKAVDDRSGCAVMIETMRRLAERDIDGDGRRRRERAGGGRAARRRPRGLPRAARRRDRARRHARGRHARDRVPPAADQARRRPGDQVLRLGARLDDRLGRAAAPDAAPRGGRRAGQGAVPARGAARRRDRRGLDRAGRRRHAHRLRLDPLAPHPLRRRRRPPRRHGAVRRPAAGVRRAAPAAS